MKTIVITKELENKSRWREPYSGARFWFAKSPEGNLCKLRALTEMEAIDRLREAFPSFGLIIWISEYEFNKLNHG